MNSTKLQPIFLVLALSACMDPSPEYLARQVPILAAAIDCETEKLKTLTEGLTQADLAQRDSIGRSALHWAIYEDCDAGVEILLEVGADPNQTADEGTPLHWAAGRTRIAMVRSLLAHGADPHMRSRSDQQTALYGAAGSGDPEILRLLLNEGLEASDHDLSGVTPLHYGVSHPEIARILIENGADVNARTEHGGSTPLLWLRGSDRVDAGESIRTLLAAGADLHARSSSGATVVISRVQSWDLVGVRAFLQAGAAVNVQDDSGQTALALIRDHRRQWREGFVKLLLRMLVSEFQEDYEAKLAIFDEIEALLIEAGSQA